MYTYIPGMYSYIYHLVHFQNSDYDLKLFIFPAFHNTPIIANNGSLDKFSFKFDDSHIHITPLIPL